MILRAKFESVSGGNGLEVTLREFVSGQKIFNRYRLVKMLGRGGMGIVWLAHDEELERDVALKFLPDLIIHDRAVLGDLKRETRRSLELTHKNIVRIYDFVHDDVSGCISMEHVDGDTLSNLRADKPKKVFETHELTEWISQLCDALDYAHNHAHIVHRDLKPANLMVNQRGDLKVADFGIARSLSDSVSKLTMQQGKSGTLVYMSPQQLEGERGTPIDDVYSVGASIYELLTSKPPFYSGNIDRQIREKIPPPMMQRRAELEIEGEPIDPAWQEVVYACLAKDPARRPQSVSEIASRLEVPSPKTRRVARATLKKSRKLVAAFAVAGIALLVSTDVWYFGFIRGAGKVTNSAAGSTSPEVETAPVATATGAPDLNAADTRTASPIWPEASQPASSSRPPKLFAGTWRGTVHSVGPQSRWDSQLELNIDETETHLSNMTGGSVSRHGSTLTYRRFYKLGSRTNVQIEASLTVDEDDRTATYTTSQVSVTGKSSSKTSGRGTLEKIE